MSMEISDAPAQKVLTFKIASGQINNLAWSRLQELMENELGKDNPELCVIPEAEFCLAIMKAVGNKCSRIVVELLPDEAGMAS